MQNCHFDFCTLLLFILGFSSGIIYRKPLLNGPVLAEKDRLYPQDRVMNVVNKIMHCVDGADDGKWTLLGEYSPLRK